MIEYAAARNSSSAQKDELIQKINTMARRSQIHEFPQITRDWFQLNNETIKLMNIKQIEAWILQARQLLTMRINQHRGNQTLITKFLTIRKSRVAASK